jgi:hypothetical protein
MDLKLSTMPAKDCLNSAALLIVRIQTKEDLSHATLMHPRHRKFQKCLVLIKTNVQHAAIPALALRRGR